MKTNKNETKSQDRNVSHTVARDVVDGKIDNISAFVGRKQSNLSSKRMSVRVKKLEVR